MGKRKCSHCQTRSPVEDMTVLNVMAFCNYECATQYGYANRHKGAKIKHTAQKKKLTDNDKPFRLKCAQSAFNAFIRKRDELLDCISCNKTKDWSGQWHAGHFKTTKARSDIRFNEDNCHKQCSICNNHLSGNIGEYTPKLIERIGQARYDALLLETQVKYSCEELKSLELRYKKAAKALE